MSFTQNARCIIYGILNETKSAKLIGKQTEQIRRNKTVKNITKQLFSKHNPNF